MIPGVAFLGDGKVYLRGDPILLQEQPEGDSQREKGVSGVYHRLLKLATSSVPLGTINSLAQADYLSLLRLDRVSARVSSCPSLLKEGD